MKLTIIASFLSVITAVAGQAARPIKMVTIPAGHFWMGSRATGEDFDEAPAHRVTISQPFQISETEITNAQYEQFRPDHRAMRQSISTADDHPVVLVSWDDAVAYCEWLSSRTGLPYRLPTESEWEYACRAGTYTPFSTGDGLPEEYHRNQRVSRDFDTSIDLSVGQTPPNHFGLYDMHGNVEEWCLDWYAPYSSDPQTDPCGPATGIYRVTRGGSHHTPEKYLRSANRSAMLPDDRHLQTGFRIVCSDTPLNHTNSASTTPLNQTDVDASATTAWTPTSPTKPLYIPPIPFVIAPSCGDPTPFYSHNHQPAVTYCDNGDLLAIWFSANQENGREITVLASRLRNGQQTWDPASEFLRVPDRNLTGSSLLNDGRGRLIHINGLEATGDWQNLALILRQSTDNGATWSAPRIIAPQHAKRHQAIAGPISTSQGYIIQACDAGPGGSDGTALQISRDNGETWSDPWDGAPLPDFARDTIGTTIAGIHAGIVELSDGRLLALGRSNSIVGPDSLPHMPMSISSDGGATWKYRPSPFPPIDGGQRLILRRLNEGPILLISFTDHPIRTPVEQRGMIFTDKDGNEFKGYGLYAALSFDDGQTWPVRKLITDGEERLLDGGAWTGLFLTDATHAEPRGYLACTQTPDNVIHLLSSRLHYRFNLAWLTQK